MPETLDALTDVAGLAVGHHTLADARSGCSVVLCPEGVVAGVDVRGAAPGTRETDLLRPENSVGQVHALLLSGGSAFGLDAAGGVMRWLDERGHGLAVGPARVPIVPAAVLFDLWLAPRERPGANAGYAACEAASSGAFARGSVGAGAGASVGKLFGAGQAMKGGIGTASRRAAGFTVSALVAVNAVGDVVEPDSGRILAGARSADGSRLRDSIASFLAGETGTPVLGGATTIGVVATDARLDKAGCQRLATAGHDGLARCIRPVHTASDGDTLFALATGRAGPAPATLLHVLAAEAVAAAVLDAVLSATGRPGLPSAREWAAT
ncbi:peptidase S58 [Rubrivivax gelatinosus]|uniref:P1 family peptidase n=1 Tax=Rubrivivax gelatinosus TaxID=28068 RepID=UPI00190338E3|nr:P1 family peptidase [Rubrivivax gelatinosus]MBK1612797.1 peptidase S58 [Rubrivivax gelatinosus]